MDGLGEEKIGGHMKRNEQSLFGKCVEGSQCNPPKKAFIIPSIWEKKKFWGEQDVKKVPQFELVREIFLQSLVHARHFTESWRCIGEQEGQGAYLLELTS